MAGAPAGSPAVSARTRRFVHLFLAAFVVCGVPHLELLPFSGFRLFAEPRGDQRRSWQLRAVDDDGEEHPIVLGDLPLSFRGTSRLIDGWTDLDAERRDGICRAWSGPLRSAGVDVTEVRIYRVVTSVRPGAGPPQRDLAHICAPDRP